MAIIDARQLENGHVIRADLCIVGAGPAGIAIAKEFAQSRLRVALIESGGFDIDADTWSLANGQTVGIPYPVQGSRLRYFGGTSNHWDGNVRPLDPLDFEKRSWVSYSGWPFSGERVGALLRAREGLYGTALAGIGYRSLGSADGDATMAKPSQ